MKNDYTWLIQHLRGKAKSILRPLRIAIISKLDHYIFVFFVRKKWSILKLSRVTIFNFRAIPPIASNSSRSFSRFPLLNPQIVSERERSFQCLVIRHGSRPHSSNPPFQEAPAENPPKIRGPRLSLCPPPPPLPSVSIPPRFPDPFWSLGLCKRGDKGQPRNARWKHIYRGQ